MEPVHPKFGLQRYDKGLESYKLRSKYLRET
jgi:hypothetical protein